MKKILQKRKNFFSSIKEDDPLVEKVLEFFIVIQSVKEQSVKVLF